MNNRKALVNGVIYTGHQILKHKALLIKDGQIEDIVDENHIPEGYVLFDALGNNICAGLIDLQIYGAGESLFSAELDVNAIYQIENTLLSQGCTSFYLTLATNTLAVFNQAIEVFKSANRKSALGLHLEGPFLNAKKRGAHPKELIIEPTVELLQNLLEQDQGVVKMITVAPELICNECLDYLKQKNILISAGHSDATYNEALNSFDMGIKTVTHLWNAMSILHHRQTGLPGATFSHPSVCASIIVDGIHVDYNAVKISKALLKERLFLITDAVAKCNKGIYKHIFNKNHYELEDGTLSGSALSMLDAIRNCVQFVGIDLHEAIRMATLYPSNLIKREDLGRIEAGATANILVFSNDFIVNSVFLNGDKVN